LLIKEEKRTKLALMILLPILAIGLIWGSCSLALGQSSDDYKARIVVEPKADGRYVTIRLMCTLLRT
jgi:hypothetical protein